MRSRMTVQFSASTLVNTISERKTVDPTERLALLRRGDKSLTEERRRLAEKYGNWMYFPQEEISKYKELVRHQRETLWQARQWAEFQAPTERRSNTAESRGKGRQEGENN
jgi:hypothetical protein